MIYIFGGGTIQPIRSHLALSAPAYGNTARQISALLTHDDRDHALILTKMADHLSSIETNDDVADSLLHILNDDDVTSIVFNVAMCDFSGAIGSVKSGKHATRLSSRESESQTISLKPTEKVISLVKQERPDVQLVGFKTTAGATLDGQVLLAKRQMAEVGSDIVLANDVTTRSNVLVINTGHEILYTQGDRLFLLSLLVEYLK